MPQQQKLNPYASPKAQVSDVAATGLGPTMFFPVGLLKLSLMSVVTFGLYEVYLFYKTWDEVRRREGISAIPVLRAIFYPLFAYSAFRRIKEKSAEVVGEAGFSPGVLAIVLILLVASTYLPDPAWLISMLSFVPLLPVQSAVNRINAKHAPGADLNARFGGWNVFGIVLGVLLWGVVLLGLFAPIESID